MATDLLQDNAVIGLIVRGFDEAPPNWAQQIGVTIQSSRPQEQLAIVGAVPRLELYNGTRQPQELRQVPITLVNQDFDMTLKIPKDDLVFSRQNILEMRIQEMIEAVNQHWIKLLSQLIDQGAASTYGNSFDGQYFFSASHKWGDETTQSNAISVTIATLPCAVHGTTTAPSVEEAAWIIVKGVQQLMSLKDDRGEPINQTIKNVVITCPVPLVGAFALAATRPVLGSNMPNPVEGLKSLGITFSVVPAPRLTWTTKVAFFRAEPGIRPAFAMADRVPFDAPGPISGKVSFPQFQYLGLDSEYCKINKATAVIVDASRCAAYADPRAAVQVTMA